ncbi:MAG: hypothetical protein ACRENK_11825 [Gemmatimonadaceae bacterium]
MKKLKIILGFFAALFFPLASALAATTVDITPSVGTDSTITISGDITDGSINSIYVLNSDPGSTQAQGISNGTYDLCSQFLADNFGADCSTDFAPGDTLHFTFCNADFPAQDAACSNGLDPDLVTANFTFSSPGGPSSAISIPVDFEPTLTANVGDQLGDAGTLLVDGIAMGIPLVFYVIHQLIYVSPKRRSKKIRD